ncbi:MAG: hypothetical protein ACYDG8_05965 [Vulcanimicrobiaceae bacterium]
MFTTLAVTALLVACGGGGSGSPGGSILLVTQPSSASPTPGSTITNASGTLVNYQTMQGMGGVPVAGAPRRPTPRRRTRPAAARCSRAAARPPWRRNNRTFVDV